MAPIEIVKDTIGLKQALRKLLQEYVRWHFELAEGTDLNKRTVGAIDSKYLDDIIRLCRGE